MSKSTISTFQLFEMFPDAEAARVYEARLLKARLARAVEVMRRVNPALSAAFQGGMEEREGGSANRQARYMESVDQLRADARAFLSEQENRHGNG